MFEPVGKEHSRGSTEFLALNLRQIGPGVRELLSDIQINIQTNRDYNFIHIDICTEVFSLNRTGYLSNSNSNLCKVLIFCFGLNYKTFM